MDCLFCKIVNKEIAAEIIAEDKDSLAFLDIQPRAPGHTLVVSKTHRETLADLKPDEIIALFTMAQKICRLLKKNLEADGLTIGINQGRASGQAIDHLHIHILPRYFNDRGSSIHLVVDNPPKEGLKEIKKQIIKNGSS